MPHKRKTRQLLTKKNGIPSRVQLTKSAPVPEVSVVPHNGSLTEQEPPSITNGNNKNSLAAKPTTQPRVGNKLATAQFNTVIGRKDEIDTLNQLRPRISKTFNDLTPRSKAAIAPNFTVKLNFEPNRPVFKNLLPLNVNDSVLERKQRSPAAKRASKDAIKQNLLEPQLMDYVEPIQPIDFIVPEPELMFDFPQDKFNFFAAYKRNYKNCY